MDARPATVDDAPEVIRLARSMFETIAPQPMDEMWEVEAERHIRERLGVDVAIFVLENPRDHRRLVASAAGTITRRLPGPFTPLGRAGYVQWVCTDPEFRGQGLARQVMEELLNWFDDNKVPVIELHATPMAEALYESLGFSDKGPRALRLRRLHS